MSNRTAGAFTAKYTKEQRAACVRARLDQKRGTYRAIAQLAAAGALQTLDGQPLEPFTIDPRYVAQMCRHEEHRRIGKSTAVGALTDAPTGAATDAMIVRLIAVTHREIARLETVQKRSKPDARKVDGADIARIAGALERLRRLETAPDQPPEREHPTPRSPDTPTPAQPSATGLGASLIRETREDQPLRTPEVEPQTQTETEHATHRSTHEPPTPDEQPGSRGGERILDGPPPCDSARAVRMAVLSGSS